ncbi:MAG: hypothetical protein CMB97_00200 [Flavobacteriaceae bacterium]|nr:hypothetical protein [Flavobacteriaceae bacterium]
MLPQKGCVTQNLKIHGAIDVIDQSSHLHIYGSDEKGIQDLIRSNPRLGDKIHPNTPNLLAEVVWAARYEMARTVEDVLARRVRILFLDAKAAIESAPIVAKLLANELNKDKEWQLKQVKEFIEMASHYVLEHINIQQNNLQESATII